MTFKDHFTKTATAYGKYRPHYPEGLFRYLASISPGREWAWDCATGSGQAASGIAAHFANVIATDASEAQLRNAQQAARTSYVVGLAEEIGLRDSSMDLIMAAQAAHWFDLDRFYSEVDRSLGPKGVIALWCYSLLRIDPGLDAIIGSLYSEITGPYWPPERKSIDERYLSLYFPFPELNAPYFEIGESWSLDRLVGYLGTWSAVNRYKKARGHDPVSLVYPELLRAWGDPAIPKRVLWPIHMRVGRR